MSDPTVRLTDALRENAEALRDLGAKQIAASGDPLTVFRNLHKTLAALRDAWPALSESAGFEDFFNQEDATFTDDIRRGLSLTVDSMRDASNSI